MEWHGMENNKIRNKKKKGGTASWNETEWDKIWQLIDLNLLSNKDKYFLHLLIISIGE